ncbi:MAG: hypothetical protein V9E99_11340 [Microthrixaceae bacterium]
MASVCSWQFSTSAAADNPATDNLESTCDVVRPESTGSVGGVAAVVGGEPLTFRHRVTVDAGTIYQDILARPDGSTYVASALELTFPASSLLIDPSTASLTIGGANTALIDGSEPRPDGFVRHVITDAGGTTVRVYFPGDPSAMLADPEGAGVASFTVPADDTVIDVSVPGSVPTTGLVEGRAVEAMSCMTSLSTGPSVRNTARAKSAIALQVPHLDVKKSADVPAAAPGSTVSYTVKVSNLDSDSTGRFESAQAHDVVATDVLPAELAYVADSASPAASWNAATRTLSWTLASLAAGANRRFTYRAAVDPAAPLSSQASNVASVTATSRPGTPSSESSFGPVTATNVLPVGQPRPTIDKSAPRGQYGYGDIVQFTVRASFPGGAGYPNATVTDQLPDGFTFGSTVSASCISGCAAAPTIGDLTPYASPAGWTRAGWYLGNLGVEPLDRLVEIVYSATVDRTDRDGVTIPLGTVLTNTATVGTNLVDRLGTATPNLAVAPTFDSSSTDALPIEVNRPVVEIAKSVNRPPMWDASPTDNDITWTIDVTNTGGTAVYNVRIRDTSVTNWAFDAASYVPSGVTRDASGVFNIPGPIAPGATEHLTFRWTEAGTATRVAALTNTAVLQRYSTSATDEVTYTAAQTVTASVTPLVPQLALTKQPIWPAPAAGVGGDTVEWELVLTNTGTGTAYNPVLADTVPTGFIYVANSASVIATSGATIPGAPALPLALTGTATNLNGLASGTYAGTAIAPGGSVTVRLRSTTGTTTVPGTYTNAATATAVDGWGNANRVDLVGTAFVNAAYRATANASIDLEAPKLAISKTPDAPARAAITQSGVASYTITVTNTGAVAASNVVVRDTLPAGLLYNRQAVATAGFQDASNLGGLWTISPDPQSSALGRPTFTESPTGAGTTTTPTWTVGRLDPGATLTITVPISQSGAVPADLTFTNTADVTANGLVLANGARPSDTGVLFVTPTQRAPEVDKSSARTDGAALPDGPGGNVGTSMTYTLTWTIHEQSVAAFDLSLVDTLPNGLNFGGYGTVSCSGPAAYRATSPTQLTAVPQPDGTTRIGWFLGDRALVASPSVPGSDTVYTLTYTATIATAFGGNGTSPAGVPAGTPVRSGITGADPLVNLAMPYWRSTDAFTAPGTLPDLAADLGPVAVTPQFTNRGIQARSNTRVYTPALDVRKTASQTQVDPDEEITYHVVVRNVGSGTAYAATVSDDLATGQLHDPQLVSITPGATATLVPAGGHDTWSVDIASLAPGAEIELVYTARAPGSTDLAPTESGDSRDLARVVNSAAAAVWHTTPGGTGGGDLAYSSVSGYPAPVDVITPMLSTTIGPLAGGVVTLAGRGSATTIRAFYDNSAFPNASDRSERILSTTSPGAIVGTGYLPAAASLPGTSYNNTISITLGAGTEYVPGSVRASGILVGLAATTFTFAINEPAISNDVSGRQVLTWDLEASNLPSKDFAVIDQYSRGLGLQFTQRSVSDAPVQACGITRMTGRDATGAAIRGTTSGMEAPYRSTNGYCGSTALVRKWPDVGTSTDIGVRKPGEGVIWTVRYSSAGASGASPGYTLANPTWEDTLPSGLVYVPGTASFTDGTTTIPASALTESVSNLPNGATKIEWSGLPTFGAGSVWTATIATTVDPSFAFEGAPSVRVTNSSRVASSTAYIANVGCSDGSGFCNTGSVVVVPNGAPTVAKAASVSNATYGDSVTYTVDATIPALRSFNQLVVRDSFLDANVTAGSVVPISASCVSGCGPVGDPTNIVVAPLTATPLLSGLRYVGWLLGDGDNDGTVDGAVNVAAVERVVRLTYSIQLKALTAANTPSPTAYTLTNTADLLDRTYPVTAITGIGDAAWVTKTNALHTASGLPGYPVAASAVSSVSVAAPQVVAAKSCAGIDAGHLPRLPGYASPRDSDRHRGEPAVCDHGVEHRRGARVRDRGARHAGHADQCRWCRCGRWLRRMEPAHHRHERRAGLTDHRLGDLGRDLSRVADGRGRPARARRALRDHRRLQRGRLRLRTFRGGAHPEHGRCQHDRPKCGHAVALALFAERHQDGGFDRDASVAGGLRGQWRSARQATRPRSCAIRPES